MRSDLYHENLHATERLILSHISWEVNLIAEEETVKMWVARAHDEADAAHDRFAKYLPVVISEPENSDDSDYAYSFPNGY